MLGSKDRRQRTALGGGAHGMLFFIRHGNTMHYAPTGDVYRKHGLSWFVPLADTDEQALDRIARWKAQRREQSRQRQAG